MRFRTAIVLVLLLSALGLTYEIAAGRVLAPFFGASLLTWTAVIAVVLAGFSLGSAWGGLVAERPRRDALRRARGALALAGALMALSPAVLGLVYAMGARGTAGMALAVTLAFFPASVLVTLPSPLLAKLAVEARPGREGSSLGLVLAAGSLGAILGAVLAGFVLLPLAGAAATFAGCGIAALSCALALGGGRETAAPLLPAALMVGASLLLGPVCRYESGLSCIDVAHRGGAVHLYADRVRQAAERTDGAERLVLPYTQVVWARMDADLGPAPRVLFVGGGGYSLPARLLTDRPAARAVAVEIDPLITRVARAHLPWAGAVLDAEGDGGRLQVVHADGRVHLNETDARFDAAVIDAFSSDAVPAHLATRETYARLARIVEGPVYVNLIDAPGGPLARGVHAILEEVFAHVEATQGPLSARGRTNVVLAASMSPLAAPAALPAGYGPAAILPGRAFTDDRGWAGHR